MKKNLRDMVLDNKKVILRVDYNVPMQNGMILDDTKIRESLPTIEYLLEKNCKIIILSHLGKVKSNEDKARLSLVSVSKRLKELLKKEVYFCKENFGQSVVERVMELNPKEILMLENTRFLDYPNRLESKCHPQLAEFWASLGDVFVNDAFGTSHRRHASTYGISNYLPSCIGFLMEKEITSLNEYILEAKPPFTIIMGGAKIDDKISLIEALLPRCDHILCGGGIANTCLKALGFEIGSSIASDDPEIIRKVQELLLLNREKFMLPVDVIVGSSYDKNYIQYKTVDKVFDNEVIYDIGTKTLERYKKIIDQSQTIFLNGTVGLYENMKFANGTKELFQILKNSSSVVVVGGGDAASSVRNLGYANSFTYISSGGGATLEYLATHKLIALDNIKDGEIIETLDM